MIKNLSQFKKAISSKREFKILEHYVKPEHSGEIRVPKIIQSNAFTSVVKDDPESKVSKANGGKGYYYWYGKASDYEFDGDKVLCKHKDGSKLMLIEFL